MVIGQVPRPGPTQPAGMTKEEMGLGALHSHEVWWRDHYTWLLQNGYQLRKRYEPDWIPSWKGKDADSAIKYEDGVASWNASILDAVRLSDGAVVCLKMLSTDRSPMEVEIHSFLSSPELRSDPRNHCAPLYDVLHSEIDPTHDILVLPALFRFFRPAFETIGEIIACISQLFEGMQFMHEHLVAHRDSHYANVMMDASPLFPEGWHFTYQAKNRAYTGPARALSRSASPVPVKYYFIDFGISWKFAPQDEKLVPSCRGGDRTAPELLGDDAEEETNPFPTDVYYIGNLVRVVFLGMDASGHHPGYRGLEFLHPLIADMTQDDPDKRPTMSDAIDRLQGIIAAQSEWKLRSPTSAMDEFILLSYLRGFARWKRVWDYRKKGVPAVRTIGVDES